MDLICRIGACNLLFDSLRHFVSCSKTGTPKTYKPLEDFGLNIHSNFSVQPDIFLFGRALKRTVLQADVAAPAEGTGQKQCLASVVKAQKSVAMLPKGRELRKGFTQILL